MSASSIVHTDVLVVGYGPVGAALGCLLGQYGTQTLIVDRATDIFMAPRAIALDNEALRILQMAGLAEDAFARVAIPHVRMHCPYVGEFARINTSGSIDGHAKLATFYQPEMERALRAEVAKHSSVQTRLGVELTGFEQDGDGVRATLGEANGRTLTVRARYLVGADGASSLVRRVIGQDFQGQTYAEDWLIVDAQKVPRPIDHVEFICDPKRPTPHMVAPGARERWEFMLRPGETREQMERPEAIRELLRPWGEPEQMHIERKAVYRFHARTCESFQKGRVFLVGDAAHITPPFVGQGLVAGLRDVANLGWKLAWVLRGQAAPAILDSYDQERRPHAKAMIGLARLMGHLVMPRNATLAILIHGFMRLLRRIPGLREYFEELGIKPKNCFGRGLFARGRGKLRRGGCLAQAVVRDGDGRRLLSDDALGPQLALVGFGLDPAQHLGPDLHAIWERHGGRIVQFCRRGETLHRGEHAYEDFSGALVPGTASYGWCAVVRPDRTILHDGPIGDVDRLVREAVALLVPPQPAPSALIPEVSKT